MTARLSQSTGEDDASAPDEGPPAGRTRALFDRRRRDRAGVNGVVRYVLFGAITAISTAIVANVAF